MVRTKRVARAPDDVPRRIDTVSSRPGESRRQEHVQIHHAVGGAVPKKRMSRSIGSSAPTDLPAGGHSVSNRFTKPAGVKIDDTLGAARPEESVPQRANNTFSNLLAAAHAIGGRAGVSADRME